MENSLILVAEDEREISAILVSYLEREGYRTVTAADGDITLTHHLSLKPDLVLLDVQLPKRDGISVLREMRKLGDTPVIMATARAENLDKLLALELGADDYIVKPFNPMEVVARVKAVLRRTNNNHEASLIRFGDIEIDKSSYGADILRGDERSALDLTLTEYRLLTHLASKQKVFSRAELVDACLPEGDALERTVDSHISNLRHKLERAGARTICAVVRGVGYRLMAG
ncbi:response regulator [Sphingorhabdus sp. EL138]|uniref:response regulator n=1 Tax=Sphingorhabdus sp. EL138 TaxID=2073156 RepID=UPI000D6881C5|nr:response regulator [Sphingorhabdus sp. EL138]